MRKKLLCIVTALALVLATGAFAPAMAAGESADTVTIYTTNDIHGVVEEVKGDKPASSSIGMAQAAGIAASTDNALLIDAGDATQGSAFASVTLGEDVIKLMNAAGYDAMAAGNHEFDYGKEQLLKNRELAEFPFLSANVTTDDGSPLLEDNTVMTVGGHRIGFIGLTTVSTLESTNPDKLQGVNFNSEIDTAKAQIASMADSVDAIVLVCHLGDNTTAVPCASNQLLDCLDGKDLEKVVAVIDGHSHTVEKDPYVRDAYNIPVVQTGTQFTNLGEIVITFDGGKASATGRVMDYTEASEFSLTSAGEEAKARVLSTLAEIKKEQEPLLGKVICTNEFPLWGGYVYWDYVESRIVETAYGDFVTDAFAYYAKEYAEKAGVDYPVIAVENGGGISQTLPSGKVTRGDILNAFNHGNTVDLVQITPQELYAALEAGLTMTGQDKDGLLLRERVSGSFLQVSGFSYTYYPAVESGKVTDVTLADGTKLSRSDNSTMLLLATNNYVSSWFDAGDKLVELDGEDAIVEDYLSLMTDGGTKPLSIKTVAGRIKLANDKSPATYTVTIPVADGDGEAVPAGRIVHVSIDGGEEQEFVTDESGNITLTLSKGGHTLYLKESTDAQPFVYVNNYSGSGTVFTRAGYYKLGFTVDAETLSEAEKPQPQTPQTDKTDTPKAPAASAEADKGDTPRTGDESALGLWLALLAISGTGAGLLIYSGKKRHIN